MERIRIFTEQFKTSTYIFTTNFKCEKKKQISSIKMFQKYILLTNSISENINRKNVCIHSKHNYHIHLHFTSFAFLI